MQTSRVRCLLVSVVAIRLGFACAPAAAQTSPEGSAATASPSSGSLSDSLAGPAKAAYEAAKVLEANSDFVGALQKLEQAYETVPDPRLLYEMAVCQKNLHRYARMQALLMRYLRAAGSSIPLENRAAVEDALSALKALVATLRVEVSPPGATIRVDGEVVGISPLGSPLTVDLGTHIVAAASPGFLTAEQTVSLEGGGTSSVSMSLVEHRAMGRLVILADDKATVFVDGSDEGKGVFQGSVPAGAHLIRVTEPGKITILEQVELADGETRTLPVQLETRPGGAQRAWGVVLGIVGLVVVSGSVVLGFLNKSGYDSDNADGCVGTVCTRNALSDRNEHIGVGNVLTFVFVGGAALVGGGIALYVTAPSAKEPVHPVLALGPNGIRVEGVW